MDIDALMKRAEEYWRGTLDAEEETAAPEQQPQEETPIAQVAPEPAADEEQSSEPADDPVQHDSEPEPADVDLPEESAAEMDQEPDLQDPVDPAEVVDEMTTEQEPDEIDESEVAIDEQDAPIEEPTDPWDDVDSPDEPSLSTEQFRETDDTELGFDMAGERQRLHKKNDDQGFTVDVKLPEGWESEMARTIQQRMAETQEVVRSHVDDEMSRSVFELDVLGSD